MEEKTVFAQITPPGLSATAALRVSGNDTADILRELCSISTPSHHRVYVRKIVHEGHFIDRAVITFFKSPHSYTGEDTAEISVHGGFVSIGRLKQALYDMGYGEAEPGEFTKRAYLNNKMDLMQAEAVLSIIHSRTLQQHETGLLVSEGELSREIKNIRDRAMKLRQLVDGAVDFPDDIPYEWKHVGHMTAQLKDAVIAVASSAKKGMLMANGLKVLITGSANSGKSTIFNRLIREDRAIITDEPGTTRDILSEWINVEGIPVLLMDSAGIRHAEDKAEQLGIEKVYSMYAEADMILFVFDLSRGMQKEDQDIYERIKSKNHIVIGNKNDLADSAGDLEYISISALNDNDISEVINRSIVSATGISQSRSLIISSREARIMNQMSRILTEIDEKIIRYQPETLSYELKRITDSIGQLTGRISNEDMLNSIFSNFCIGK